MVFYSFYVFSLFQKDLSFRYTNPSFESAVILSVFEVLNIVTILIFAGCKHLTISYNLDIIICSIIIFGLNYFIFIYKSRYKKIVEKCKGKKTSLKDIYFIFTIIYVIASIYIFIVVY